MNAPAIFFVGVLAGFGFFFLVVYAIRYRHAKDALLHWEDIAPFEGVRFDAPTQEEADIAEVLAENVRKYVSPETFGNQCFYTIGERAGGSYYALCITHGGEADVNQVSKGRPRCTRTNEV